MHPSTRTRHCCEGPGPASHCDRLWSVVLAFSFPRSIHLLPPPAVPPPLAINEETNGKKTRENLQEGQKRKGNKGMKTTMMVVSRRCLLLPGFQFDFRPVVSDLRLLWLLISCLLVALSGLPSLCCFGPFSLSSLCLLRVALWLLRVALLASVLSPCPSLCGGGGWGFMCFS